MVILAIDHGFANIGLSLSDETQMIATRLPAIKVKTQDDAIDKVAKLAAKHSAQHFVIGLPLHVDGNPSEQTQHVIAFAKQLSQKTKIAHSFWNEFLTSSQAIETGYGKNNHSEAARIILQEYLDANATKA